MPNSAAKDACVLLDAGHRAVKKLELVAMRDRLEARKAELLKELTASA